jgi:diguanylate cyclase (GGDEF)-like protein
MLCDLDRFKSINDRFGHAAGDEVIRRFGANLLQHFGEDALCGRVGGEEFCILLPDCSPETAQAHWESVRCLGLRDRYVSIPADVAVTASFGVAIIGEGEPFDVALHRADMAMYAAKAAGRDCYRLAPATTEQSPAANPFRIRDFESETSTEASESIDASDLCAQSPIAAPHGGA